MLHDAPFVPKIHTYLCTSACLLQPPGASVVWSGRDAEYLQIGTVRWSGGRRVLGASRRDYRGSGSAYPPARAPTSVGWKTAGRDQCGPRAGRLAIHEQTMASGSAAGFAGRSGSGRSQDTGGARPVRNGVKSAGSQTPYRLVCEFLLMSPRSPLPCSGALRGPKGWGRRRSHTDQRHRVLLGGTARRRATKRDAAGQVLLGGPESRARMKG